MRMNSRQKRRDRARISLWAAGVVALCAGVPNAAANDFVQIMPSVWDAAAALSLSLAALMGSKR
jgi:hypothetical protein